MNYWSCVIAGSIAFTITALATPLVHRLARLVGAMDMPDNKRRIHTTPTARLGGLGVAAAFFLALALVKAIYSSVNLDFLWSLLPPVLLLLAVGVVDDIKAVRPITKLAFQIAAAAGFWIFGFGIDRMFQAQLAPWLSMPLTIAWYVACANAMNLFDGMDGLASGLGVFAAAMILLLSLWSGKLEMAIVSAALCGACVGFLVYNFPPAVIFLGDTGSLFLGMMLGWLAVEGSFKSHVTFAFALPLIVLALPFTDTTLAVLRRLNRRVSVFSADRDHIHHRIIALGFSRRQALLLLYGVIAALGALSLAMGFSSSWIAGLIALAVGMMIVVMVRLLGSTEFHEFGFFIVGGLDRRRQMARNRRLVREGMAALQAAESAQQAIDRAIADLKSLGCELVEIDFLGAHYGDSCRESLVDAEGVCSWSAELNAGQAVPGKITVVKKGGLRAVPPEVPLLVETYARALAETLKRYL